MLNIITNLNSNQNENIDQISTINNKTVENSSSLYYPLPSGLISTFLVAGHYSSSAGSLSHIDLTSNFKAGDFATISNSVVSGSDGSKIWTVTTEADGIFGWDGTTSCSRYLLTYMYLPNDVTTVYFYFNVDDDIRLYIDGVNRYDDSDGTSDSGTFNIGSVSQGWHRVIFAYYNGGGADESRVCLLANNNFNDGYTAIPGIAFSLNPVDTFDDNDAMGGENRGFLKEWLIAGSFWEETTTWTSYITMGNQDFVNCSKQYCEGQQISPGSITLNSTYQAKTWQKYISATNKINFLDSSLNLNPTNYAAVYAFTKVYFPKPVVNTYLLIGSNDGHRVFFDGINYEYSRSAGARDAIIDNIPTSLGTVSAGWHDLMIMVENYVGPWDMYVRFSNGSSSYEPIIGLSCQAPESAVTVTTDNTYIEMNYNTTESRTVEWKPTVSSESVSVDYDPIKVAQPVLWYNFENSSNLGQNYDSTKNATQFGAPAQIFDSERGKVIDFYDGAGNFSLPNLGTYTEATIAFWICLKGTPTDMDAIFHDNYWGDGGELHISLRGTNARQIYSSVNGGTDITVNSPVILSDYNWYFFTQTYSSTALRSLMYFNGQLNVNQTLTVANPLVLNGVQLGTFGNTRTLNAKLDDVMVFNRLLSTAEIQALYIRTPTWMQNDTIAFSFNSSLNLGMDDYGSEISANFTSDAVLSSDLIRGNALSLIGAGGTGSNGFMQICPKLRLTNEWSASAWYNTLETSNTYSTLFHGDNTHLMVQCSDKQLGAYDGVEGVFVGTGYYLSAAQQTGWHHIAAVGSGGRIFYYLDGSYVGTLTSYAPLFDTIYGIGNKFGTLNQRFADAVDEIKFFQRALNPTEIQILANDEIPSQSNGIYQFYLNNSLIQTGYWSNQNNITLNYTGNIEGIYNYTLKLATSQGYCANSTIQIWIDSKPINPTMCTDSAGSVNNTWQNDFPKPNLIWSGASNLMSGVAGYFVYFGDSATGESTTYFSYTTTSYTPSFDPLNGTAYYFRIRTLSENGSYADWQTIYIFKYDLVNPINPTYALQTVGDTSSDVWQNTVNLPRFIWSGVDASEIFGYYLYFGNNILGESTTFQTSNIFVSSAVNTDIPYYLRVKSVDNAGNNATEWATIYIFKYDHSIPQNPTICNQTVGTTTSNVWQNSVNSPVFNWSGASDLGAGITGYYVYWGINETGESTNFQTTPSFSLNPALNVSQIYYLRIQTTDGCNRAVWTTLYIFCFDDVAPTNPVKITSSTHRPNVNSNQSQITVSWDPAYDASSGVAGYCVIWTTNRLQHFDLIMNSTALECTSPSLSNGSWYFILYTLDNAGNWVKLEKSAGPYIIGESTNIPENPDQNQDYMIYVYISLGVGAMVFAVFALKVRAKNKSTFKVSKEIDNIFTPKDYSTNDLKISKTNQVEVINKSDLINAEDLPKPIPMNLQPASTPVQLNLEIEKPIEKIDPEDVFDSKGDSAKPKPGTKIIPDEVFKE